MMATDIKNGTKIGIVTIHFAYNYGAMLQAFSLQHYLNKNGYESEIIDYRPSILDTSFNLTFRTIVHPLFAIKQIIKKHTVFKKFESFLKKEIIKTKRYKLVEDIDCSVYEYIILGSDQVLNPLIVKDLFKYYCLYFVKKKNKKISFSSSFGVESLDLISRRTIRRFFKDFKTVSVREKSGVDLFSRCGISATKTCDPVFLLEKSEWDKIINTIIPVYKEGNYILSYSLGQGAPFYDYVAQISEHLGIPVIDIHPFRYPLLISCGHKKILKKAVGPIEFVWLLSHSSLVVSDSFHAISFSCIFRKTFTPFYYPNTGGRIREIIDEFGLIPSFSFIGHDSYQINNNNQIRIDKLIDYSKQYLGNL